MNNLKARDFLLEWAPDGYWVLTAIDPEKKEPIVTHTFTSKTQGECVEWLDQYNGKRNIYFSVNQPLTPLYKKADRS
jgi:hypothetical protein